MFIDRPEGGGAMGAKNSIFLDFSGKSSLFLVFLKQIVCVYPLLENFALPGKKPADAYAYVIVSKYRYDVIFFGIPFYFVFHPKSFAVHLKC
jgi:hypothetical protein